VSFCLIVRASPPPSTLPLHDALPICRSTKAGFVERIGNQPVRGRWAARLCRDGEPSRFKPCCLQSQITAAEIRCVENSLPFSVFVRYVGTKEQAAAGLDEARTA